MLLLLKTNDCLRHADRQLGSGINSFLLTLRYCVSAIRADEADRWRSQSRSSYGLGVVTLALHGILRDIWLALEGWLLTLISACENVLM